MSVVLNLYLTWPLPLSLTSSMAFDKTFFTSNGLKVTASLLRTWRYVPYFLQSRKRKFELHLISSVLFVSKEGSLTNTNTITAHDKRAGVISSYIYLCTTIFSTVLPKSGGVTQIWSKQKVSVSSIALFKASLKGYSFLLFPLIWDQ